MFKTAPIIPLETEAAVPPVHLRLKQAQRKYALRVSKLGESHPIRQALARINLGGREGPPTTRLEQLKAILASYPPGLEEVEPFLYPPWYGDTPYTTRVSTLDKKLEGQLHENLLLDALPNRIALYSDASVLPKGKGVGVGVSLIDCSLSIDEEQAYVVKNLGPNYLVYNGELEGITTALELAIKRDYSSKDIRVYVDNQAALLRLRVPANTPGQQWQKRAINAASTLRDRGNMVSLEWVPGHVNVRGNERADKLAKQATDLLPESNGVSYGYYGIKAKAILYTEWETQLKSAPSSTFSRIFDLATRRRFKTPTHERELASAFYQLRIGHGYFNSYLYRSNHATSDRCRCSGTAAQTPRHLLLSCPITRPYRGLFINALGNSHLDVKDLFSTPRGITAVVEFLKTTKISTRRWILNNSPDEE